MRDNTPRIPEFHTGLSKEDAGKSNVYWRPFQGWRHRASLRLQFLPSAGVTRQKDYLRNEVDAWTIARARARDTDARGSFSRHNHTSVINIPTLIWPSPAIFNRNAIAIWSGNGKLGLTVAIALTCNLRVLRYERTGCTAFTRPWSRNVGGRVFEMPGIRYWVDQMNIRARLSCNF